MVGGSNALTVNCASNPPSGRLYALRHVPQPCKSRCRSRRVHVRDVRCPETHAIRRPGVATTFFGSVQVHRHARHRIGSPGNTTDGETEQVYVIAAAQHRPKCVTMPVLSSAAFQISGPPSTPAVGTPNRCRNPRGCSDSRPRRDEAEAVVEEGQAVVQPAAAVTPYPMCRARARGGGGNSLFGRPVARREQPMREQGEGCMGSGRSVLAISPTCHHSHRSGGWYRNLSATCRLK